MSRFFRMVRMAPSGPLACECRVVPSIFIIGNPKTDQFKKHAIKLYLFTTFSVQAMAFYSYICWCTRYIQNKHISILRPHMPSFSRKPRPNMPINVDVGHDFKWVCCEVLRGFLLGSHGSSQHLQFGDRTAFGIMGPPPPPLHSPAFDVFGAGVV